MDCYGERDVTGVTAIMAGISSGVAFRLDSDTYQDFVISPATAETTLTVNANGSLQVTTNFSGILADYNWITPTTGSGSYYVRLSATSGSFTGNTGVWLPVGQAWSVSRASLGTTSASGTLAIASDAAGTNIVASASITLVAQVDI
jgi:hypothetical protein